MKMPRWNQREGAAPVRRQIDAPSGRHRGIGYDAVKKAGWDNAAVRETVLTVAYFNYVNRVSLGLGIGTRISESEARDRDLNAVLFPALLDQFGHQRGPAGLVAGAQSRAIVSIEILKEQNQIAPERIVLEDRHIAVHGAAPVLLQKNVRESPRNFAGHFPERLLLPRTQ